jgi:hypothetical protein
MFPRSTLSSLVMGTDVVRVLSFTRGSSVATSTAGSTSGFAAGTKISDWFDNTGYLRFASEPLGAITISGNVTINIRAAESNAMANYGVGVTIQRYSGGSLDATILGSVAVGAELGTTEAARSLTTATTSTAIANGDRIVVTCEWYAAGGTTASGYNLTGYYNGAAGATGDTFVTFTETIVEASSAADPPPYIGAGYYWMGKGWNRIKPKIWLPRPGIAIA